MKFLNLLASILIAVCFAGEAWSSPDKSGVDVERPSVSPVEGTIAFSADFDGSQRIWICNGDGSGLRKLLPLSGGLASAADSQPSWSPDGRRIAFASTSDSKFDIWVMQSEGTYPVRLTSNGADNSRPVWSPDGRKIAFVSDKDGSNDLWVMNADGSQQRKLLVSDAQEGSPSFSPGGDQVVFTQTDGQFSSLKAVNVDGSNLRTLTSGSFRDWDPDWGPRGIVFCSNRASADACKLWSIQPDGSSLRQIGDLSGYDPAWMADGNIVFVDADTRNSKALSTISVANPTSGTKRVLVDVQGYSVSIDIRPRKPINRINPRSGGRIEVAILSSQDFDAPRSVDRQTLTFGRTGAENSFSRCARSASDVNGDGRPDLVCRFDLRSSGFRSGDSIGILRFSDTRGRPYEGRDAVVIWPEDDPDDFKD